MIHLTTQRLELRPITLAVVEAVMAGRREELELLIGARVPHAWPGPALIARAFTVSLEQIRRDPNGRLWGDRLVLTREDVPRVVGSVVFHGNPGPDGRVEIAYGIEEASQRKGYATEAVRASVAWALNEPSVTCIEATTPSWHRASLRVLEKAGLRQVGVRDHDMLGELLIFETRRKQAYSPTRVNV